MATYDPNARSRTTREVTAWCAAPFDDCAEWYQDTSGRDMADAKANGWRRVAPHGWLCPDCRKRVSTWRVERGEDDRG